MGSARTTEILSEVASRDVAPVEMAGVLVELCAASLPVTGAGLALMDLSGPAGTVAVSDAPAGVLEDLQFTLGEGPCVDSSRWGRPVLVDDLAVHGRQRWPGFTDGALAAGARAVYAVPLRVGMVRLGVLDLYRDAVGTLSAADLTEAFAFGDAATSVLLHLQATAGAGDALSGPGVVPVLEDRAEVHQATGVVSVQADVPVAPALVLLRARAFAEGRSVLDVARDVLSGAVSFREGAAGGP